MKKRIIFYLLISSALLLSFSIFTNSDGYPRRYIVSSLPMTISVHESVEDHTGWYEAITDGAYQWNEEVSAYFEFEFGALTTVNARQQDGINLVYFDDNYDNFTPGGNVIAFSATFTSGSGASYRAVESDLIYNAAGFPPGINAEPDLQDLQSVISHEFGHHLGLGHCGDDGNDQPGNGDVIPDAVMFWASSPGDTMNRHLHIDDIMGLTAIYPRIKFTGTITDDEGAPVPGAFINISSATTAAYVTEPTPIWGYQRGGYVKNDTIPANDDGTYLFYTTSYNFDATFFSFGYESYEENFALGETSTEVDQTHNVDITLNPLSTNAVQYNVLEQGTGTPVNGRMKIFSVGDPSDEPFVIADITEGVMEAQLPDGTYDLEIIADMPHEYKMINNVVVSSSISETVYLRKAQILLVDHDYRSNMSADLNRESYYLDAMMNMGTDYPFTYHDEYIESFAPDQATLNNYDAVIWYTGNNTNPVFGTTYTDYLEAYLENGGNIFVTGQGLLIYNMSNSFFSNYLKVSYAATGPTNNSNLYVNTGNPISGDWMWMQFNGGNGASNQTLPDELNLQDAACNDIFYYHPQGDNKVAGMYYEDATYGYKVVYLGFGFEALVDLLQPTNSYATRAQFMENVIDYFNVTLVGIEDEAPLEGIVESFQLKQNYPNPFNPETNIEYHLKKAANVELAIYNSLGQKVRTLVDKNQTAGVYTQKWDGKNSNGMQMATGIYYYRIKAGDFMQMHKMLLMK